MTVKTLINALQTRHPSALVAVEIEGKLVFLSDLTPVLTHVKAADVPNYLGKQAAVAPRGQFGGCEVVQMFPLKT